MTKLSVNILNSLMAAGMIFNFSSTPFLAENHRPMEDLIVAKAKIKVVATAYSSTESQTDSTPEITASNKKVYDGVLAANFLKFGTKVRVPSLFGDKIFIVEDRMNSRFNDVKPPRVDVWFRELADAKKFGVKNLELEILN